MTTTVRSVDQQRSPQHTSFHPSPGNVCCESPWFVVKPCKYSSCIIGTIAVRGLLQTTAKTKRQATTIEHPAVTPAISSFVQIAFCNLDLLFFDLKRNEDKTRLHPSVSMPAPAPKYMMLYTHTLYFPCPFQLSRCTDAWWPRASRAIARRPRAVPMATSGGHASTLTCAAAVAASRGGGGEPGYKSRQIRKFRKDNSIRETNESFTSTRVTHVYAGNESFT